MIEISQSKVRLPRVGCPKSDCPGIDEPNPGVFEMRSVSGCKRGLLCERNPRNHRVAEITRTASLVPRCHEIAGLLSSRTVKRSDSLSYSSQKFLERLGQQCSPAARCQNPQS